MLRIFTSILFSVLVIASVFMLFVCGAEAMHPGNIVASVYWIWIAEAALVFIMSCVGLFILITTKAHITISKQFVSEKPVETTKKSKRK